MSVSREVPHEVAVDPVVQADAEAVPAERQVLGDGGLAHRERGVPALVVQLELGRERVHAGRLQPLLAQDSSSRPEAFSSAASRSLNSEFENSKSRK